MLCIKKIICILSPPVVCFTRRF